MNGNTKKGTEVYKGKKIYFEQMFPLAGTMTRDVWPVGTHTFPFAYQLAANLPPSIKGVHGNCTYTVKAILDRPWRPNETIKKEFTVATLHVYPLTMLSPAYEECVEELWSMPFKTCPFRLHVEVAQHAFRVGDGIPVSVQLEHESNITIHEVKFQLRQVLSFYSQQPMRKCKTEFTKVLDIRCKVMDSKKLAKFQRVLQIPHLPVTYLTHSELVAVAYEIRVEVKLGSLNKNPIVTIPVVIGTGLPNEGQNMNASIGFEPMALMNSSSGVNPMFNISQLSSISTATGGMSQASTSLMDMSSSSYHTSTSLLAEQASAPPSYNEVVVDNAGCTVKQ